MIGDVVVSDGVEFEVAWDGRQSLLGDRPSKPINPTAPSKRLYKKSGKYSKMNKEKVNCGGSGMVLYNPGPNQAGEMCPGCPACDVNDEELETT